MAGTEYEVGGAVSSMALAHGTANKLGRGQQGRVCDPGQRGIGAGRGSVVSTRCAQGAMLAPTSPVGSSICVCDFYVCLFVCLFACLSLSVSLSVLSTLSSFHVLPFALALSLSLALFLCLSICASFYRSVRVCMTACVLSVHLPLSCARHFNAILSHDVSLSVTHLSIRTHNSQTDPRPLPPDTTHPPRPACRPQQRHSGRHWGSCAAM